VEVFPFYCLASSSDEEEEVVLGPLAKRRTRKIDRPKRETFYEIFLCDLEKMRLAIVDRTAPRRGSKNPTCCTMSFLLEEIGTRMSATLLSTALFFAICVCHNTLTYRCRSSHSRCIRLYYSKFLVSVRNDSFTKHPFGRLKYV